MINVTSDYQSQLYLGRKKIWSNNINMREYYLTKNVFNFNMTLIVNRQVQYRLPSLIDTMDIINLTLNIFCIFFHL